MVAQIDKAYIKARPSRLWSRLISYGCFEGRPLTTRGRWINPLVFAAFGLQKRIPALRRVREPAFILGTGRSGTTILGIVLSMHRRVGFLNEPKALWHSLYAGEDLIGSYSMGNANYRVPPNVATPAVTRQAHRIFGHYLWITGNQRVVDKYPELIFRVPFVQKIFPDAKFIFLSRDGWSTSSSIMTWSAKFGQHEGGHSADWWGQDGRKWTLLIDQIVPEHKDLAPHADFLRGLTDQRLRAVVEWIVTMREGLRLVAEQPEAVIHLRYEDLCAEPDEQMERLLRALNLPEDEVFRDYARSVLRPVAAADPFPLPNVLQGPFHETQLRLGYETAGTDYA
ncbi:hypothetical protein MASR1M32_31510 [Rhodobacter sp.]